MKPNKAMFYKAMVVTIGLWTITPVFADTPEIPIKGNSLADFVPSGYEVGVQARGDFNGDGKIDVAALLWVAPDSVEPRPFLVLLSQADGSYRLSFKTNKFSILDSFCGGGNSNCVPDIKTKGKSLLIQMAWGSAAGYEIFENEFRLIHNEWYRVRRREYGRGDDIICSESAVPEGLRCIEAGTVKDFLSGVATKYCKIVDAQGKTIRFVQNRSHFQKSELKKFAQVEWEEEPDE